MDGDIIVIGNRDLSQLTARNRSRAAVGSHHDAMTGVVTRHAVAEQTLPEWAVESGTMTYTLDVTGTVRSSMQGPDTRKWVVVKLDACKQLSVLGKVSPSDPLLSNRVHKMRTFDRRYM